MYTEVQFSDWIVLSELYRDTYIWLSMHYIKLPKCIYKTEREHLRGAPLMPSNNTADLFQVETFLPGYFVSNSKYKQTCLVMTKVAFHIPIISVVSYSTSKKKKAYEPLQLYRLLQFLRLGVKPVTWIVEMSIPGIFLVIILICHQNLMAFSSFFTAEKSIYFSVFKLFLL